MSASAGKVMPRPMGNYNAATEYKILDIVTYNDRPYMALQTTIGNLPTNTTYWMLLLDFPTEVDNVPTQNSQNLVRSGGVYNATADKMKIDASNADNIALYDDYEGGMFYLTVGDIAKSAGTNEDVVLTVAYTSDAVHNAVEDEERMKAYVGNNKVWFYANGISGTKVYVNFSTVTRSSGTVTATGKLVTDDSAAISLESVAVYGPNAVTTGHYSIVNGYGAVNASNARTTGTNCVASGTDAVAEGEGCIASGGQSHALGSHTQATAYNALATGSYTEAKYQSQLVTGKYNDNKSNTLLEVGSGTASNRKNAFEVYDNGYISMNGTDKYKFAKSGGIDGFYDTSNNFHPFYKELVNNSVVLSTSADTTVTFSDASITADSTIEPFTSVYSIAPKDCVASAGQCVVTIPKQSTAQTIQVKIRVS